jgi:hypothetical protein
LSKLSIKRSLHLAIPETNNHSRPAVSRARALHVALYQAIRSLRLLAMLRIVAMKLIQGRTEDRALQITRMNKGPTFPIRIDQDRLNNAETCEIRMRIIIS